MTLPVILALRLEPALRPQVAEACQGPGLEGLCDRLAGHPGVDLARERALEFVAAARGRWRSRAPPAGPTSRPCARSPTASWTATRERPARPRIAGLLPPATRWPPPRAASFDPRAPDHLRQRRRAGTAGWWTATRSGPWTSTAPPTARAARARRRWPTAPAATCEDVAGAPGRRWPSWPPRPGCCARSARCRPTAPPTGPARGGSRTSRSSPPAALALPDGVAVRPHWRRLGPAACQVAAAFGATDWRVPADDRSDPAALAAAVGARGGAAMRTAARGADLGPQHVPDLPRPGAGGRPGADVHRRGAHRRSTAALLDGRLDVSAVSSIAFARHADALHAGAGGLDHRLRRGRLHPALLAGAVRRGAHGGGDPPQRDLGGAAADPARPGPGALRDPRRAAGRGARARGRRAADRRRGPGGPADPLRPPPRRPGRAVAPPHRPADGVRGVGRPRRRRPRARRGPGRAGRRCCAPRAPPTWPTPRPW